MLALMRLGATVIPLNPTSPPEDWSYILEHSHAQGCIASPDLLPRIAANDLPGGFRRSINDVVWPATSETPASPSPKPVDPVRAEASPSGSDDLSSEMAIILYTSGTTGRPKGVVLRQSNILSNAWSMARAFGLSETTQFAVLPLYHAHAFGFGLMTALSTSGHLVFAERFDPFSWSEVIRNENATISSVVPTLLAPLLQTRISKEKVPSLRALLVSSAPLSVDLAREFEERAKIPIVQGWGLSEYSNFACCMSPHDDRADLLFRWEVPSVGPALEGTEVRVVDAQGNAVAEGARGELSVRGHSTMLTYLDDPDATAKTIDADGWLRTGDEGFFAMHREERVYFITGRIKEIIIRDGDKWSPIALERVLVEAVPELRGRIAILGFPHKTHGEEIGAYVEADGFTDELATRLEASIETMPSEQRPKIVLIGADPIPRTHTGKVQRRRLLPLYEAHATCRGAFKVIRLA